MLIFIAIAESKITLSRVLKKGNLIHNIAFPLSTSILIDQTEYEYCPIIII